MVDADAGRREKAAAAGMEIRSSWVLPFTSRGEYREPNRSSEASILRGCRASSGGDCRSSTMIARRSRARVS